MAGRAAVLSHEEVINANPCIPTGHSVSAISIFPLALPCSRPADMSSWEKASSPEVAFPATLPGSMQVIRPAFWCCSAASCWNVHTIPLHLSQRPSCPNRTREKPQRKTCLNLAACGSTKSGPFGTQPNWCCRGFGMNMGEPDLKLHWGAGDIRVRQGEPPAAGAP